MRPANVIGVDYGRIYTSDEFLPLVFSTHATQLSTVARWTLIFMCFFT